MFRKLTQRIRRAPAPAVDRTDRSAPRGDALPVIDIAEVFRVPAPPVARAASAPTAGVVADTLVPSGILGPGGQAGIPTIPAVTMPAVDWTEPIPAGLRLQWRYRSDDSRLRRAGRAGAEGAHHGDPLDEPGIAHLASGLRATLSLVLRSDPELLGAEHFRRSWEFELRRRGADLALAEQQRRETIAAANGIAAGTADAAEQPRWTAARNSETVLRDLEIRVREAELHHAEAEQYAEVAGRRALERLDLVARAGVDRLSLYRTAFNKERTDRPGLDPLSDDLAEQLIRRTVQPILDENEQPPPAEAGGGAPGALEGAA